MLLHRCLFLKISTIVEVSLLRDESKTDRVNLVWSQGAVASSLNDLPSRDKVVLTGSPESL